MEEQLRIESSIRELLEELNKYALDQFPKEIQDELADEWYDAEMEAKTGADREAALQHIQQFVDKLASTPKIIP